MDNIFEMLGINSNTKSDRQNPIPKEILDQYPYGEFPLRYTKSGQEIIRKQSENRYSHISDTPQHRDTHTENSNLSLTTILPLIQMLSSGKKNSKDLMQIFSKLLFKDNPDMQKLINLIPNLKGQELKTEDSFPNTNKIQISSLKKID